MLSFQLLRAANVARLPTFRTKDGNLAHSKPDGSDWTPADWMTALVGEVGELANIMKKYKRGDLGRADFRAMAEEELADIQTYLDLLAMRIFDLPGNPTFGVDLGMATVLKFNKVSRRVGSPVRIHDGKVEWVGVEDKPA